MKTPTARARVRVTLRYDAVGLSPALKVLFGIYSLLRFASADRQDDNDISFLRRLR